MIDWDEIDREYLERQAKRAAYRSSNYTGVDCKKCGRNRVMNCADGRHVCEKCGWDNDKNEYTDYLHLTGG